VPGSATLEHLGRHTHDALQQFAKHEPREPPPVELPDIDIPSLESILLVGLLGGFTSYSTFAFHSVEMLETGRPLAAAAYIVATNVAALAAVWAGLRLAG
jgi:hypothetical protein